MLINFKKGECMKKVLIFNLLMVSMFLFTGCVVTQPATKTKEAVDASVYTRYNIHGQQKTATVINASYANLTGPFQGHVVIPMNTKVTVKSNRRGFEFLIADPDRKINFQFDGKRMGMSKDDYLSLITSPQKVSTASFSKIDCKGIEQGKALKGMTKNGVMAALGYPAAHRTLSLESNQWVYWKNKFGTKEVIFTTSGIVKSVRE